MLINAQKVRPKCEVHAFLLRRTRTPYVVRIIANDLRLISRDLIVAYKSRGSDWQLEMINMMDLSRNCESILSYDYTVN